MIKIKFSLLAKVSKLLIFSISFIRNGEYATSPLIGKYCGNEIPQNITSHTNFLYLKFVTDDDTEAEGFVIHFDSTTQGLFYCNFSKLNSFHNFFSHDFMHSIIFLFFMSIYICSIN